MRTKTTPNTTKTGLRVQTGLQSGDAKWCADCFEHCDHTASIGGPRNIECKDRCCIFDDICPTGSPQCKRGAY